MGTEDKGKFAGGYWLQLWIKVKENVTGGLVAFVLTLATIYDATHESFRIPPITCWDSVDVSLSPWLVPLIVLLYLVWIQHKMWRDLRRELHRVTAPERRFKPTLDEGMEWLGATPKFQAPFDSNGGTVIEFKLSILSKKSERVRVSCDRPVRSAYAEFSVSSGSRKPGLLERGRHDAEIIDMYSFYLRLPLGREPVVISVEGSESEPVGVRSITWDPSKAYPKPPKKQWRLPSPR